MPSNVVQEYDTTYSYALVVSLLVSQLVRHAQIGYYWSILCFTKQLQENMPESSEYEIDIQANIPLYYK